MARSDITTGRQAALEALRNAQRHRVFVQDALHATLDRAKLDGREAALATELAMGVTRHRLTLRRILSKFIRGQWESLDPDIKLVLSLGAYQLLWLARVPDFAGVSSTVELAKAFCGQRSGSLVNAVLRSLLRSRTSAGAAKFGPAHRLMLGSETLATFDKAIFPDPERDLVGYLSATTSHPKSTVKRWLRTFGEKETRQICTAGASRPRVMLRANRLRTTVDELMGRLADEGATVRLDKGTGMLIWESGPHLTDLPAFRDGLFQPQDPTAKAVIDLADPKPEQAVVDLCGAPGTKASYVAELMENRGRILASDISDEQLRKIKALAKRLGHKIISTCLASKVGDRVGDWPRLDLILVDTPCSNSGVYARRPEARYRLSPEGLEAIQGQQCRLLDQAADLARAETRIVYSTCSLEPEENQEVISTFCRTHPGWVLRRSQVVLPATESDSQCWHDGGFMAELVREG